MRILLPPAIAALLLTAPLAAQDRAADIDRIFSFATAESPGCLVGVSQNGEVVIDRAYGLGDVERRIPLTPNTRLDIGSVQKQFTAASILLLVQDGKLSLSDDIRTFIPELQDYGATVTVEHLLTHTSGIRDWPGLLPIAEPGVDAMTLIKRQRGLNFKPGDEWAYSSSGYELAKEIVARVSGMSFAEFTKRRLFDPLGMTSTEYVPDAMQASGSVAVGYQKEGNGWKQYMRLGNERGGGAIISTPRDMLRWNDALTAGRLGRLVTQKLHEPAKLNNGRLLKYAHGLMLDSIPGGRLVSHDGGAAGYSTWLGRFMEAGLSIAVTCNFDPVSATQLAGRVADLYLPPVDPNAPRPGPVAAPGVDVNGRAGLFFETTSGEPIRLVVNNGRLVEAGGSPLVAVSADRFQPQRPSFFYHSQDNFEITFRSNDEFVLKSMEGKVETYRRAQPYSITASDLKGLDGRYFADDIGSVFEVVPRGNGLELRFERDPGRPLFYEAVAPDTYILNAGVMRFSRDAAGNVTGFVYTSGNLRNVSFPRIGDRKAGSPPASSPAPASTASPAAADAAAAPAIETLTGQYEAAPGRFLTVTVVDGKLYGETTGGDRKLMTRTAGATFAVEGTGMQITFTLGADGRPTALVMKQGGSERVLPRVN
jgi:CubicO group peptidase (beta-lactamase class C family)